MFAKRPHQAPVYWFKDQYIAKAMQLFFTASLTYKGTKATPNAGFSKG
jgi:hypothetical protein